MGYYNGLDIDRQNGAVQTILTLLVPQGEEWIEQDDVRVSGWVSPGTKACADCPGTAPTADIDTVEYDVVDQWGGLHRTTVDLDDLGEDVVKELEGRLLEQATEDEQGALDLAADQAYLELKERKRGGGI